MEVDTLIQRVHQTHGVEFWLNTLQRGAKERGWFERELDHEGDGDAKGQM